jgi:predicted 3-demethylubiquinone-9 3-methyltransferase (glyoxalase superfamily)
MTCSGVSCARCATEYARTFPDGAVSFQIVTDDQAETDHYWNAIVGNGGTEGAFEVMMKMTKIDVATIEAAHRYAAKKLRAATMQYGASSVW